ncbi:hypothetical protein FPQ18DRAFT_355137 [Pyronema domesticum]|nr:hypothetical protein FPQ18DRAFT_355137 [Pyronema domesticum]
MWAFATVSSLSKTPFTKNAKMQFVYREVINASTNFPSSIIPFIIGVIIAVSKSITTLRLWRLIYYDAWSGLVAIIVPLET